MICVKIRSSTEQIEVKVNPRVSLREAIYLHKSYNINPYYCYVNFNGSFIGAIDDVAVDTPISHLLEKYPNPNYTYNIISLIVKAL